MLLECYGMLNLWSRNSFLTCKECYRIFQMCWQLECQCFEISGMATWWWWILNSVTFLLVSFGSVFLMSLSWMIFGMGGLTFRWWNLWLLPSLNALTKYWDADKDYKTLSSCWQGGICWQLLRNTSLLPTVSVFNTVPASLTFLLCWHLLSSTNHWIKIRLSKLFVWEIKWRNLSARDLLC